MIYIYIYDIYIIYIYVYYNNDPDSPFSSRDSEKLKSRSSPLDTSGGMAVG